MQTGARPSSVIHPPVLCTSCTSLKSQKSSKTIQVDKLCCRRSIFRYSFVWWLIIWLLQGQIVKVADRINLRYTAHFWRHCVTSKRSTISQYLSFVRSSYTKKPFFSFSSVSMTSVESVCVGLSSLSDAHLERQTPVLSKTGYIPPGIVGKQVDERLSNKADCTKPQTNYLNWLPVITPKVAAQMSHPSYTLENIEEMDFKRGNITYVTQAQEEKGRPIVQYKAAIKDSYFICMKSAHALMSPFLDDSNGIKIIQTHTH